MRSLLELWFNTPAYVRRVVAATPITFGSVTSLITWDWAPITAGAIISFIILLFSFPSDSEKKGYHF